MKHRKVQCVRPGARPGEDDVQANLDACKGRVPRQKEDCIGTNVIAFLTFFLCNMIISLRKERFC